jgi:hypothetical protein
MRTVAVGTIIGKGTMVELQQEIIRKKNMVRLRTNLIGMAPGLVGYKLTPDEGKNWKKKCNRDETKEASTQWNTQVPYLYGTN